MARSKRYFHARNVTTRSVSPTKDSYDTSRLAVKRRRQLLAKVNVVRLKRQELYKELSELAKLTQYAPKEAVAYERHLREKYGTDDWHSVAKGYDNTIRRLEDSMRG